MKKSKTFLIIIIHHTPLELHHQNSWILPDHCHRWFPWRRIDTRRTNSVVAEGKLIKWEKHLNKRNRRTDIFYYWQWFKHIAPQPSNLKWQLLVYVSTKEGQKVNYQKSEFSSIQDYLTWKYMILKKECYQKN